MSDFQQKVIWHTIKQKTQFEETEQASEPDSDMAVMLELSDQKFKITMINMIRAVNEKVDDMQEQMDNVSRQMEILRKNHKEMLEIKNCNGNEDCL